MSLPTGCPVAARWLRRFGLTALFLVAVAVWPLKGQAQDLRASLIAEQQAQKARKLKPYEQTTAERITRRLTGERPSGFYPVIDSVYRGGNFTLGAGYRRLHGEHEIFDVRGLYSISNYKLAEMSHTWPALFEGVVQLRAHLGWRDAPQVAYYGLGMKTSQDDRTNFRFQEAYGGLTARMTPSRWTVLSGAVSYEGFTLLEGKGSPPSIEEVHTPATAPGLGASPDFIHGSLLAGIDWRRPAPGYARRGGLYAVQYHNYADRHDANSFDRMDVEIIQHLPIFRETWVLSLRGFMQTTLDNDDVVPFFMLPSLGSSSTLRAYSSWRFRDRHSMVLQGEWRWFPNRAGMDIAFFYDAGKVTARRSQLGLAGLKSDVGIGVRFHGLISTPLRIELAHGSDGLNIVFSANAAF